MSNWEKIHLNNEADWNKSFLSDFNSIFKETQKYQELIELFFTYLFLNGVKNWERF